MKKKRRGKLHQCRIHLEDFSCLKDTVPNFHPVYIMSPEGEVVRKNEPLFTRSGVITEQLTRGKGKAEAKYMAGL